MRDFTWVDDSADHSDCDTARATALAAKWGKIQASHSPLPWITNMLTNRTKLAELRSRWASLVASSLPDSVIDEELQQLEDAMDALPSEWEAIHDREDY